MKKIAFVQEVVNASTYYRLFLPAKALRDKYDVLLKPNCNDIHDAQIVVFNIQASIRFLEKVIELKESGKKIVIDCDDDFFHVDPTNPQYQSYSTEAQRENVKTLLGFADAVTVTVLPLADSYSSYNANVTILPNCVDRSSLGPKKTSSETIVGWQGGDSHFFDLKSVKSVVNELQAKYRFTFVLAGYTPNGLFKKAVLRRWVNFSENLAHCELFRDFTIGICPLENNEFNVKKSDIKFLEYSSMGIPTVASNNVVYNTVVHGETGLLARNQTDWRDCIGELIENEDKRTELGIRAKDYVEKERLIQKNIWRWEELFNNL